MGELTNKQAIWLIDWKRDWKDFTLLLFTWVMICIIGYCIVVGSGKSYCYHCKNRIVSEEVYTIQGHDYCEYCAGNVELRIDGDSPSM